MFRVYLLLISLLLVSSNPEPNFEFPVTSFLDWSTVESHSNKNEATENMDIFRLPDATEPRLYELKVIPNLDKFNFEGEVTIHFYVNKNTSEILLHAKDLNVTSLNVSCPNGRNYSPTFKMSHKNELIYVTTSNDLIKSQTCKVDIKYTGELGDNMKGFYRSSYKIQGQTKWLATTQFEPTYARMAFPCYDEPRFRAIFKISIMRSRDQISISNMKKFSTTYDPQSSVAVDNFDPTPPMPTYLVAFVVSEFKNVSNDERSFSVWSRGNAIDQASYILKKGKQLLDEMSSYTKVDYLLPKMDLVAVPDFSAGAMENWGLTTYRERYVLYDQRSYPERTMEAVAEVVAHEISHQWFGNLVTPKWWNYLWLNEAFATYFGHHLLKYVEPSWRMDELYVIDTVHYALFADEYFGHAMNADVKTPKEIKEIFDGISYQKGGSVVRMLEHMVTHKTFKEALHRYLEKGYRNGGTVEPDDLWEAFDEQVKIDKINLPLSVKEIMGKWSNNIGYPLIYVHAQGSDLHIEQTTYKASFSKPTLLEREWVVPITYTKKSEGQFSNTFPKLWLHPNVSLTLKKTLQPTEWVIFNLQQTGYYRVNYDEENWSNLIHQLQKNYSLIHPLNRAQLIDDSVNLAADGIVPYTIPVQLLTYLDKETDMIPWFSFLPNSQRLYRKYETFSVGPLIKEYVLARIVNIYNKIGFKTKLDDDHLTKAGRSSIVSLACSFGLDNCIKEATRVYTEYENKLNEVDPNVRYAVYCSALKSHHENKAWQNLWNLYRESNVAVEKENVLMSLGCAKNRTLLRSYLMKLINGDDEIRSQNRGYVLHSVLSNENGVLAGLELVDSLIPQLDTLSTHSYSMMMKIINHLKIRTDEHLKLLEILIQKIKNADQSEHHSLLKTLEWLHKSSKNAIKKITASESRIKTALGSGSFTFKAQAIVVSFMVMLIFVNNKEVMTVN